MQTTVRTFVPLSDSLLTQRHAARQEKIELKKRASAFEENEAVLANEIAKLQKENAELRALLKTSEASATSPKPTAPVKSAPAASAPISNLSKVENSIRQELERNNLAPLDRVKAAFKSQVDKFQNKGQ